MSSSCNKYQLSFCHHHTKMPTTTAFLVFIFSYMYDVESAKTCVSLLQFARVSSFDNTIIPNGFLWTLYGRYSVLACALECTNDQNCIAFFYNTVRKICHGVQFHTSDPSVADTGSLFYSLSVGKSHINVIILQDSDNCENMIVIAKTNQ